MDTATAVESAKVIYRLEQQDGNDPPLRAKVPQLKAALSQMVGVLPQSS